MTNIVFGFNLFTLLTALVVAIAHILGVIGLVTEQLTIQYFYIATPISITLIVINVCITRGLQQKKSWAYYLASAEMLAILICALVDSVFFIEDLSSLFFNLFICALTASAICALYRDFQMDRS
ncbi:hypothetical protein E2K93_06025 [Thalassotalea sp. HSM 43]|uniref:hypothetical protein n=1 Tax=Thalassotalea sp. HSM 43 TaxID=2552945 RepID=UPI00107FF9DC|nr:hypothetical protein [Thalassotalea sp. HSM 43]QBY03969.1 hypothetical protein E2K93_06025 [Thalassotalea sp. HSM 43]